jgi:hypothetical protein
MRISNQTAVDSLKGVKDGFGKLSAISVDSLESKINAYIEILEEQKSQGQVPKVGYRSSKFSLVCSNIFQRINCFSQCRFFNHETTNIYITSQQDGNIFVAAPRSIEGLDRNDNQLTNTTFFVHLYERFSDHLPYIFPVALKTLPEHIKTFWEKWNPNSQEDLEKGKATRLLKVLDEAEEVYKEIRKEIMKKELLEKSGLIPTRISPSKCFTTADIRLEVQATAASAAAFVKPQEKIFARVESLASPCCSSSLDDPTQGDALGSNLSLEPECSEIAIFDERPQRVESSEVVVATPCKIPSPKRPALDPQKKYVNKKGTYFEFSKVKLIKDLLTVSKCSKTSAQQIADEIETWIDHEVTSENLLEHLLQLLQEKNIQIKQLARSKLGDELADICDRMELSDVDDIPKEDFLALMEAKKSRQSLFCMKSSKRRLTKDSLNSMEENKETVMEVHKEPDPLPRLVTVMISEV